MTSERRVALITGASRGIGKGIALSLASAGYDIVLTYVRNRDAAEQAREEIGRNGVSCRTVQGDIGVPEDRVRVRTAALEAFGRIDFLVNNAGVAPPVRRDILETSEESFDKVLLTNLKGPYFFTQLIANTLIELKSRNVIPSARIVFITSVSAYAVSRTRGEYCVSKAGLSMTARLFAARLAEYDIPVIEVRPGIVLTDMVEPVREKYEELIRRGICPQKRWGLPEDVGKAVAAIARGDFDYSTGAVIEVGGGFELREL